jgi:hypothetical protein
MASAGHLTVKGSSSGQNFDEEFPILCETCLGENPYVRMVSKLPFCVMQCPDKWCAWFRVCLSLQTKEPFGKACKVQHLLPCACMFGLRLIVLGCTADSDLRSPLHNLSVEAGPPRALQEDRAVPYLCEIEECVPNLRPGSGIWCLPNDSLVLPVFACPSACSLLLCILCG